MSSGQQVVVAGRTLRCVVCGADTFSHLTVTLNTSGIADSGLNKRGELAVCSVCGYVHVFMGTLVWQPVG